MLVQALARKFFVEISGVVDEGGDDGGGLFEIIRLHAIVNVLVGMVGARVVIHRVLNELETRQPDAIERLMIGAAGIGVRESPSTSHTKFILLPSGTKDREFDCAVWYCLTAFWCRLAPAGFDI